MEVSVLAKVTVTNDGALPWAEFSSLRCITGPDCGFTALPLGALPPGEMAELVLDLAFAPHQPAGMSGWVMIDEQGQPFGPLLLLQVSR